MNAARSTSRTASAARQSKGPGMIIVALYGLFSLSAGARALYQILTKFDVAPVSFLLSGLSAAIYVAATIFLARSGPQAHRWAFVTITVELVGVVLVGLISYAVPELFPEPSVWSHFGSGYGYVPLVLPIIGLIWLSTGGRRSAARTRNLD